MQFHLLSFEGPDAYARAGGLASRVVGLGQALCTAGYQTHLWFVGDPDAPGCEQQGDLHLHRWCQWISKHHLAGVYEGELGKVNDYSRSLPGQLLEAARPALERGETIHVLAEEWHTAGAVLELDTLLRAQGLRDRFQILWNANNVFGFEHVDFERLSRAAIITTVSRYMMHVLQNVGVRARVIPNGIEPAAFERIETSALQTLHAQLSMRPILAKMARFDPDKRWLETIDVVAELRDRGANPLLVARGGIEAHGLEVIQRARGHRLRVVERSAGSGTAGMLRALQGVHDADIVLLTSHVDATARRLLFHAAAAVLANSGHEPFGLVGLEAMAAAGIACTGFSGEDYVVPGHNAIVLQTSEPAEAVRSIERLRARPREERAMRKAAARTARKFAWQSVIERNLLPQLELAL